MGWIPEGGGVSDLDGLSDVTITSPTADQVLVYDGSEWVNDDLSTVSAGVTTEEAASDAAPKATYANDRQAIYDPASDRTFIAFLGLNRDLYVTYYDHHAGSVATPVEIGTYPLSDSNDHGSPSITVDHDGHIHIIWGSHNSAHQHSKSDSPHDISAWTTAAIHTGTYPSIHTDPASGDLIIIDRAGSGHGASFPAHEFGGIRISDDGGATWGTHTALVDTTGMTGSANDFYPIGGATFGPDGLLHFVWTVSEGSGHDDVRTDLYHAKYDPSDGTLYSADGTDLGSSIDSSDHDTCRIVTRNPIGLFTLAVAQGRLAVPYTHGAAGALRVAVWDGTSWTDVDLSLSAPSTKESMPAVYPVEGGWRGLFPVDGASFGDLKLYGADSAGTSWFEIDTLLTGATGEGYSRAAPARGGGPIVALTLEDAASHATTSATASDLIPLQAVFDTDLEIGDGGVTDHGELAGRGDDDHTQYVLADGTRAFTGTVGGVTPSADSDLATKGYVNSTSGVGEILISDTPSTPLVFADLLQNEDQDDLVYAD